MSGQMATASPKRVCCQQKAAAETGPVIHSIKEEYL